MRKTEHAEATPLERGTSMPAEPLDDGQHRGVGAADYERNGGGS